MLKTLVPYTALLLAANVAAADPAAMRAVAAGDMRKLIIHDAPVEVPEATFEAVGGGTAQLADYRGEPVVLNLWATWCVPCRKEMPSLDALQAEMGDRLEVVTVATTRNTDVGIRRFFEDAGIANLPMLTDPGSKFYRGVHVLGLPAVLVLDAEGREIARLTGGADWASDDAKAMLETVIAGE